MNIWNCNGQRLAEDEYGVLMNMVNPNVDKNVQFNREQFIKDFIEIVEAGKYTQAELRDAFHCSIGKISAIINNEDYVQIPVEMMWFVCNFGHTLDEYFNGKEQ